MIHQTLKNQSSTKTAIDGEVMYLTTAGSSIKYLYCTAQSSRTKQQYKRPALKSRTTFLLYDYCVARLLTVDLVFILNVQTNLPSTQSFTSMRAVLQRAITDLIRRLKKKNCCIQMEVFEMN